MDIKPLRECALMIRKKIYQLQLKLAEEVYKIKQVEARLQEISVISTEFKTRTQEIAKAIQGQQTWLETNKELPENVPKKSPERLQIEYDLMEFSSKDVARLAAAVEKTLEICM